MLGARSWPTGPRAAKPVARARSEAGERERAASAPGVMKTRRAHRRKTDQDEVSEAAVGEVKRVHDDEYYSNTDCTYLRARLRYSVEITRYSVNSVKT